MAQRHTSPRNTTRNDCNVTPAAGDLNDHSYYLDFNNFTTETPDYGCGYHSADLGSSVIRFDHSLGAHPQPLRPRATPMQRSVTTGLSSPYFLPEHPSSYETPPLVSAGAPYYSSPSITPGPPDDTYDNSSNSCYQSDIDENMSVDDDANSGDRPYNELLFDCLKSAPDNEMQLLDIYQWFRDNTEKGQSMNEKAWQCSIRHNLSMNQAFVKGAKSGNDLQKKSMWRLSDEAVRVGKILPTTRYRHVTSRQASRGRISKSPAVERQRSGALGGQAARRSARNKQRRGLRAASVRQPRQHSAPASSHVGMNTSSTPASNATSPGLALTAKNGAQDSHSLTAIHGLPQSFQPTPTTLGLNTLPFSATNSPRLGPYISNTLTPNNFCSSAFPISSPMSISMGHSIHPGTTYCNSAPYPGLGSGYGTVSSALHFRDADHQAMERFAGQALLPQQVYNFPMGIAGHGQQQAATNNARLQLLRSPTTQAYLQCTSPFMTNAQSGVIQMRANNIKPHASIQHNGNGLSINSPTKNYMTTNYYRSMQQPIQPNTTEAEAYLKNDFVALPQQAQSATSTTDYDYTLLDSILSNPLMTTTTTEETIDPRIFHDTVNDSNDNDDFTFGELEGF